MMQQQLELAAASRKQQQEGAAAQWAAQNRGYVQAFLISLLPLNI
jgi:hypothetical protein